MNFSFRWLKPNWTKAIIFLIALLIPFLRERVALPEGGYVIARYSVGQLLVFYIWPQNDLWAFFLMASFALFLYLLVAVFTEAFAKMRKRLWQ